MAEAARPVRRMDLAAFLDSEAARDERFELIDGVPTAMVGGRRPTTRSS